MASLMSADGVHHQLSDERSEGLSDAHTRMPQVLAHGHALSEVNLLLLRGMAAFEAVCDGKVRALTTARVAPTQMRRAHHGASPQPKCGALTTARVAPTQMRRAHHGARRPNPNAA